MKKRLTITFAAILMLIAVSPASAYFYTMDFANTTLDLGSATQLDLTNQYDAYGLNFHQVYRYIDSRDPWQEPDPYWGSGYGTGISNGFHGQNGWTAATDSVGIDWWTIDPNVFNVRAYSAGGALLGSFTGSGSGTEMLVANGIKYLEFNDNGGFVQMANLSYERTRPVIPEPATVALFGLGLLGAGVVRRLKRK